MPKFRSRVASATLLWLGSVAPATFGQTTGGANQRSEEIAANSRAALSGRLNIDTLVSLTGPKAVTMVDGIASPGLKMSLDGSASSGGRLWYRWIQTQGARVVIKNSDHAEAHLVVPDDATTLGFVLVVGNGEGVDARSLIVEVEAPERDGEEPSLKADAGADQTVSVGRRVVLDGFKSEPKGRVRYRWVQTGGPKARIISSTGSTCAFVPESKGVYQFALLVIGTNDLVSEASMVSINVHPSASVSDSETVATDLPAMAIDELARASMASIPEGSKYAGDLSRAFDAAADRIDSYKTYVDAANDMTKRLEAVVPRDQEHRAEWVDQFIKPWSAKVIEKMRIEGIDLSKPDGQGKALTKTQRARLAEQFRFTAAGLRAGTTLR